VAAGTGRGWHGHCSGTRVDPIQTVELLRSDCPPQLRPLFRVAQPPPALWLRGSARGLARLEELPDRGLAVVGTRYPQRRSLQLVRSVLRSLRGSGLVVLSGLAVGVDAAAHEGALDAGLTTVAVLGCGLGRVYPAENAGLLARILDSHGVVASEFPLETSPRAGMFIQRNRLIACWARATWVVEAPARSGALNTARWARDAHRSCYATPSFPGDHAFAGTQRLLDLVEAQPLWGPHSLASEWSNLPGLGGEPSATPLGEPPDTLGALCRKIRELDQLVGGACLDELFAWSADQGWLPAELFLALEAGLAQGRIEEANSAYHYAAPPPLKRD
jgi:DNA protecting protein DprA